MKIITLILLMAINTFALEGKVVSIADGDTITILTADKLQVKVRLSGIDTPERKQAFGEKAKQALSYKVFGKKVTLKGTSKDRYGRSLGDVYHAGRWINLEMVQEGWAWHYKQYSNDQKLADAEVAARKIRRGLWSAPAPLPPWDYRRGSKSASSKAADKTPTKAVIGYWLNTSSSVRHNSNCPHYENTKRGEPCTKTAGKAGGCCGG